MPKNGMFLEFRSWKMSVFQHLAVMYVAYSPFINEATAEHHSLSIPCFIFYIILSHVSVNIIPNLHYFLLYLLVSVNCRV